MTPRDVTNRPHTLGIQDWQRREADRLRREQSAYWREWVLHIVISAIVLGVALGTAFVYMAGGN